MNSNDEAKPDSASDQVEARTDGRTYERPTRDENIPHVLKRAGDFGDSAFGSVLDNLFAELASAGDRLPVVNREPRLAISSTLRRGLWVRDGGKCWICGRAASQEVADHVRPRSNWPVDLLHFADRSDNLRLACWDCNEKKSNLNYGVPMPLGISAWCMRCQPGQRELHDPEDWVRCFCVRCGMGGLVPGERFYLSGEPPCTKHPGRPARDCDRCAEEAAA